MKSPVTIGSFDLTTRHDLIMHLVGLSIDCIHCQGNKQRQVMTLLKSMCYSDLCENMLQQYQETK